MDPRKDGGKQPLYTRLIETPLGLPPKPPVNMPNAQTNPQYAQQGRFTNSANSGHSAMNTQRSQPRILTNPANAANNARYTQMARQPNSQPGPSPRGAAAGPTSGLTPGPGPLPLRNNPPRKAKRKSKAPSPAPKATRPLTGGPSSSKVKSAALKHAPKPDQDYLRQAHNKPFAMQSPKRMLVILDLNGTLVDRNKGKKNFVNRPFVTEFLKELFKHHSVMVWSSAQPASVAQMVKGLMTEEQQEQLVAEWNRSSLRLTDAQYKEKVQVYKQLTWVWEDEQVQRSASQMWDQTNTVLIDDSYLKASSEPFNHIEVPEFTVSIENFERTQSPVLRELLNYLEEASYFEDVSTFIATHKFKMPGAIQGAGAPSASLPANPVA